MTNGPCNNNGGERGIRTLETLVTPTRFPIVLLRPTRTPLHVFLGPPESNRNKLQSLSSLSGDLDSPNRTRTCDNSINSRVLYQLSYQGIRLGNVLLSQNPAVQVPSTLEGLTVVFEMGTRGSPPPSSPNGMFRLETSDYADQEGYSLKTRCETNDCEKVLLLLAEVILR